MRFAAAGRHCGRRVPGPRGSGGAAGAREAAGAPAGTREAGGIPAGAGGGADAPTDSVAAHASDPTDPVAAHAPDPADAARILLLHAAGADAATVERLYAHGSGAERRAVLFALPCLELGAEAVPLVEDALRANDTRLIAAAVGPYAARHLDAHAWRHAVLKCLFTGVPTAAVAGLEDRARGDTELARMLTDFAAERTAAGRPVPADLHHVLALTGVTGVTTPSASAPSAPSALSAPTGPGSTASPAARTGTPLPEEP
ncbi:EboA domain-containing protein [Streptomyces pathocidini]|uniref:EboA domain-containing protein n=1 Tax=Streptomyces pathocidini TaxID=1650571 RepID=UPI003F4D507B